MAFVEAGNVEVDEVFLPYLTDGKGKTLYQVYKDGQLLLEGQNHRPPVCRVAPYALEEPPSKKLGA